MRLKPLKNCLPADPAVKWLLVGFAAFLLSYFFSKSPFVLRWMTLVAFIAPGMFFLVRERGAALRGLTGHVVFWPLCIFFVYSWLQGALLTLEAGLPFKSIGFLWMLFGFILCVLLLFSRLNDKSLDATENFMIACAGVCCALILVRYFCQHGLKLPRLKGFGENKNSNLGGFVFAQFALLAAGMAFKGNAQAKKPRIALLLYGLSFLACILFVILSQGKGVFISFTSGLIILLWQFGYRKTALCLTAGAVVGAATLLLLLRMPDAPHLLSHLPFGEAMYERGDSYRLNVWQTALALIPQKPWLGHGLSMPYPYFAHPHNLVLSTLFYSGTIGLILFVPCVALTLRLGASTLDADERIFYAMYCVFLVGGIADFGQLITRVSAYWIIFWLPFGILHGLRRRPRYMTLHAQAIAV